MTPTNRLETFQWHVLQAFGTLRTSFGFRHVRSTDDTVEWSVVLENTTTRVNVMFELQSVPWAGLAPVSSGQPSFDFALLLRERNLAVPHCDKCDDVDDPRLVACLSALADGLQEHAADFLRGDFSIYPRIQALAAEIERQRNRQRFGN